MPIHGGRQLAGAVSIAAAVHAAARPAGPSVRRHAQNGAAWEVATARLSSDLRHDIRDLTGCSEVMPAPVRRVELPRPRVSVVWEIGPCIRIADPDDAAVSRSFPGGFVAGVHARPTTAEHGGSQRGVCVSFSLLGARCFLGVPMHELSGRVVPLGELLPPIYGSLADRLASLPTWAARFALVSEIVRERQAQSAPPNAAVQWALERLSRGPVDLRVRSIARDVGISQKHLIALFRDQVGVCPKLLARIIRFDRFQRLMMTRGATPSLADCAAALGFADQAHLGREVRAFGGETPSATLASPVDPCRRLRQDR